MGRSSKPQTASCLRQIMSSAPTARTPSWLGPSGRGAAGLADPFSGEGIRFAVKSGRLAAQAVLKGEPQRYSDWLFHSIGRSHLRSLRVARFFYRFQRHCLELGAPNPFTTQMIAQLLADCAAPAQVMLWSVLTSPFYLGGEGVAGGP